MASLSHVACIPRVLLGHILAHDNLFITLEAVRLRDLASLGLGLIIQPDASSHNEKDDAGTCRNVEKVILHIPQLLGRDYQVSLVSRFCGFLLILSVYSLKHRSRWVQNSIRNK
jgi:hypothetical protein